VDRFVYEGQYVKEGDKLFEIADFSTMWFQFDAYENDLAWLKLGQKVEITSPSVPGKIYGGKINFIDPNVNDPTRSAKVRVEIKNLLVERDGKKQRELLHRLYAEGVVKVEFSESLVVPRSAVLNPGGKPMVYVEQSEGAYEPRKVTLGVFGDEGWQVFDGLEEGERVVISGNLLIDAQAQFNQGAMPTGHEHGVSSEVSLPGAQEIGAANLPPLNETQQKIAMEFFDIASKMSDALASDDFKKFNEHVAVLHTVLPSLADAFTNVAPRNKFIEQIERADHLPEAKDLATARKQFVPFTMATVDFAKTVRSDPAFQTVKIYKCPMANQGVPGAPKNGFWIQTEGTLRNPFFGNAMLTCGSEVKP
jgi:Cu(I)/Ag(I) efflux system membrane fusion protein